MEISLVMPNRNNLKYFKWAYDSIRKNQGNHIVWICSAADACTDGTVEHYEELVKIDPHFKYIVNPGPTRLGHTILYDKIIWDLVETEIAMIFHSDMYLCPGALDEVEKLMYNRIMPGIQFDADAAAPIGIIENKKRIVSLTRIEPPLHPAGKEKIVKDFGTEPENFDEVQLLKFSHRFSDEIRSSGQRVDKNLDENFCTNGVFAPWAFWVNEYKAIGGNDWSNFSPQSKEDSDVWNRLLLNGSKFVQTWQGFVYHMTCRGSRFNPTLTEVGTNSAEWEQQNLKSSRNFIRKWGHFVRHDEYLNPVVPHKYDIACVIENSTHNLLANLEPWFTYMEIDLPLHQINDYIDFEQQNTKFSLQDRISKRGSKSGKTDAETHDIVCYIDGYKFDGDDFYYIQYLSDIITQNNPEEGSEFELGHMRLQVNRKKTYERDLIVCKNEPINL